MIIIDDFLDNDSVEQFNNKNLWLNTSGKGTTYYWYDKSEPKNEFESFIEYASKRLDIFDDVIGFEWWIVCETIPVDKFEGGCYTWHQDRDETTENTLSEWACTYYGYPHELWGGFAEYEVEETLSDVERFAPFYNRLIFNDKPGRWHRVSRVWKGERFALSFAGWKTKPNIFKDSNVKKAEDVERFKYLKDDNA